MSKRGNENSQLRPDEVERLNDESDEEAGTFKRASTEELAKRRIIKARRPGQSEAKPTPVVAAAPASAPVSANPFSNFGGLVAPSTSATNTTSSANPFANFGGLVASKPAAATSTNPFANFGGLVAPSSTSGSKDAIDSSKSLMAPALAFNSIVSTAKPASMAFGTAVAPKSKLVEDLAESEHKKKMKKLNNSFLSWTSRQIENHPVTGWKDGVKDYLKYAKDIVEKYPDDETPSSAAAAAVVKPVQATTAPTTTVAVASAPPAFHFPPAVKEQDNKSSSAAPAAAAAAAPAFQLPPAPAKKEEEKKPAAAAAPSSAPLFFGGPQVSSFTSASPFANPFQFNATPAAPAAAAPTATSAFGGFGSSNFSFSTTGFGAAPAPATAAAASAAGGEDGGEEGGDDEGEPILEPEKVLKNDADTDDILLEVPCKLFNFNKESNEWKDTGKGTFRITQSITDKKQRMLVRNPIGKLTFNAGFYKSMKVDKVKGGVTFAAWVVADEAVVGGVSKAAAPELKKFMLKLKDVDIAVVQQKMEAAIAALP